MGVRKDPSRSCFRIIQKGLNQITEKEKETIWRRWVYEKVVTVLPGSPHLAGRGDSARGRAISGASHRRIARPERPRGEHRGHRLHYDGSGPNSKGRDVFGGGPRRFPDNPGRAIPLTRSTLIGQ